MAFSSYTDGVKAINKNALIDAVKIATRIGLRQTNVTLDLPEWDKVQKRDRLTGVSLSGIVDLDDYLFLESEELEVTSGLTKSMNELLSELREVANSEAIEYAKEMRVPTPLLVTTVKPSGTISKLPGISAGVHRSRAPYYIRRVRITSTDPLAKVMLDAGYPVYPETSSNGPTVAQYDDMTQYEKMQALQASKTWVIEFPVKTTAKIQSNAESALRQFYRYLDMQKNWTDHNTSITIEFAEDEVSELIDALLENWDSYVAVSFLPKNTLAYPLLPEQPITDEEYYLRAEKLINVNTADILEALTEIERENAMTDLLDDECATGACPVR